MIKSTSNVSGLDKGHRFHYQWHAAESAVSAMLLYSIIMLYAKCLKNK